MKYYVEVEKKLNSLKEISKSDDIHVVFNGKDGTFRLNSVSADFDKHVKFIHFECEYENELELSSEVADLKFNGFNFLRSYEEGRKITALFEHVGVYN